MVGVEVWSGVENALRLDQILKRFLLSPTMTTAADGLPLTSNICLCSQSSVMCFLKTC